MWSALAALALSAVLPSMAQAQPSAFVYASANGAAAVLGFQADGAGLLGSLGSSAATTGAKPAGVVLSPDGSSLYVSNQADASISQYGVGADGSLTPKTPAQVASGPSPLGLAIAPDGRHLYVANEGDGTVSVYAVGPGGVLTPSSTVDAGAGVTSIAVAPGGGHVYVTDFSGSAVAQFAVAADGSLSPLSPARVSVGSSPFDVAVSPDGASVYVTDQSGSGAVFQFDVGANGALAAKAPASVAAERFPADIVVGARGVYVANFGSGTISQYDAGPGGALTPKAVPAVTSAPNPWGLALGPDGASLYAANHGAASISQYDLDAGGALAPKAIPSVVAGAQPVGLAVGTAPDVTAPTVDLRTPSEGASHTAGDVVVADYSCFDEGGSGLASCSGTVPAGSTIDTDTPGSFSFTVVARDGAGHETVVTHAYTVVPAPLRWGGFRSPLVEPPGVNVRRAGSDIEIRFSLGGFRGLQVLAPGAPGYERVDCDDPSRVIESTRPAKSAVHPRVRLVRGSHRFRWETKSRWAGTCRLFTLTLSDGSQHELLFKLLSDREYAQRLRRLASLSRR